MKTTQSLLPCTKDIHGSFNIFFQGTQSKLSRGEICVANSTPPVNGVSLSYFCVKNLTTAKNHCLNKPISPFFEEAYILFSRS